MELVNKQPPNMMITYANMEQHAPRLIDPIESKEKKLQLLVDVRCLIEIAHTSKYHTFLTSFYPVLEQLLACDTAPQIVDNVEHHLRREAFKILLRLPATLVLQPFASNFAKLVIRSVAKETEENALICLQILRNLCKHFKVEIEREIQPFLEFVRETYQLFETNAKRIFEEPRQSPNPNIESRAIEQCQEAPQDSTPSVLTPSLWSFKVVAECTGLCLQIFHSYPSILQDNVPDIAPPMVKAISLLHPTPVPESRKTPFTEMKVAQVKMLKTILVLMKLCPDHIRPHAIPIGKSLANLLENCPDVLSLRMELLNDIPAFLSLNWKTDFVDLAEKMIDERVLIGAERKEGEALMPKVHEVLNVLIGYSTRLQFSQPQISWIVNTCARSFHDCTLPWKSQTLLLRIMLLMAKRVQSRPLKDLEITEYKEFEYTVTAQITDACLSKFQVVKKYLAKVPLAKKDALMADKFLKILVNNLLNGLWMLVTKALCCPTTEPPVATKLGISTGHGSKIIRTAAKTLRYGLSCAAVFQAQELVDILPQATRAFQAVEHSDLKAIFSLCVDEMFEQARKGPHDKLFHEFFLKSTVTHRPFTEVLLGYLVSTKLDTLKQPSPASDLVVALFKCVYKAMSLSTEDNTELLRPHLLTIIKTCVERAVEVGDPVFYINLLVETFGTLQKDCFHGLHDHLIPLLTPCLNTFLHLLDACPVAFPMRDALVELCINLPAKPSSLLFLLPQLMRRPLLLALQGNEHLVGIGMQYLECWIDTLDRSTLRLVLPAPVMAEVGAALAAHLRPPPYPWAAKALHILGKLGSESLDCMQPLALQWEEHSEPGLPLACTLEPATLFCVPMDQCITSLTRMLLLRSKPAAAAVEPRKRAFKFLRMCLATILNLTGDRLEVAQTNSLSSSLLASTTQKYSASFMNEVDKGAKTSIQLKAERSILKDLLTTFIATSGDSEVQDATEEFVFHITRHFAILHQVSAAKARGPDSHVLAPHIGKKCKSLDLNIFLEALVAALAEHNPVYVDGALNVLRVYLETVWELEHKQSMMGSASNSSPMAVPIIVLEQVYTYLHHCCHGSTCHSQAGGLKGLKVFFTTIPSMVTWQYHVSAAQALFYVLMCSPPYARSEQKEVGQLLAHILGGVDYSEGSHTKVIQSAKMVTENLIQLYQRPSSSAVVRKQVQVSLALLASRPGSMVPELLQSIVIAQFQEARELGSSNASEEIEAEKHMKIKFLLEMRTPQLLRMMPQLRSLLDYALNVAENDKMAMTKQKVACVDLLCTALAWDEHKVHLDPHMRSRIMTMFLSLLTSNEPDNVQAAKSNFHQVIHNPNHQQLASSKVKPFLAKLVNFNTLALPLLQGLSLLNKVVTISGGLCKNLVNHLSLCLKYKLTDLQKSWEAGNDSNIASGIIELFCLVRPAEAPVYLGELVMMTIQLEAALPVGCRYTKFSTSPYRTPLMNFLNQHAAHAVKYFMPRLSQPDVYHLLKDIIRSSQGKPLYKELAKSPHAFFLYAFHVPAEDGAHPHHATATASSSDAGLRMNEYSLTMPRQNSLQYEGVALVALIMRMERQGLGQNLIVLDQSIIKALVAVWRSHSLQNHLLGEKGLTLRQGKESKRLIQCLFHYLRQNKNQSFVLFDMMSLFRVQNHAHQQLLKDFCVNEVVEGYTPAEKRSLLLSFLTLFQSRTTDQELVLLAFKRLIMPMLNHAFIHNQSWQIFDSAMLTALGEQLFDPSKEEVTALHTDSLKCELLQLARLLLAHIPIQERGSVLNAKIRLLCQKETKSEDSSNRMWALLIMCECIQASSLSSDQDPKMVQYLLMNLLPVDHPNNRLSPIAKQALHILIPKLPQGSPLQPPHWVQYMRHYLIQKEHSQTELLQVLDILVRHGDKLYAYRDSFVQQLVRVSFRSGLNHGPNGWLDIPILAIELVGLMVAWETRSQREAKGGMGASTSSANEDPKGVGDHLSQVESPAEAHSLQIAEFLLQMAVLREEKPVYQKARDVLLQALDVWPNTKVQFKHLGQNTKLLPRQLFVMIKTIEKQPLQIIPNNIPQIHEVLELCFNNRSEGINVMVCMLIKALFTAYPMGAPNATPLVSGLHEKVHRLLCDNLKALSTNQAPMAIKTAVDISMLTSQVLESLAAVQVEYIHPFLQQLLSIFAQTTEGVLLAIDPKEEMEEQVREMTIKSITPPHLNLLGMLGRHIPARPELLKEFMQILMSVVAGAKSKYPTGLLAILDLVRGWWVGGEAAWLQNFPDDHVVLVLETLGQVDHSNMEHDHRTNWEMGFLDLLHRLCSGSSKYSPSLRLTVSKKLERLCLRGLVAEDPQMRQKFRTLFDSAGRSPFAQLKFLFEFQHWGDFGNTFWVRQGLDLLLGLLRDEPVRVLALDFFQDSAGSEDPTPLDTAFAPELEEALDGFTGDDHQHGTSFQSMKELDQIFSQIGPPHQPEGIATQFNTMSMTEPAEQPQGNSWITDHHATFLIGMSHLQVTEMVSLLRELAYADVEVAHGLWVTVFPLVWSTLEPQEQKMLTDPLISLLAQDWHSQQRDQRPNVVKTLLESISRCHPPPQLPSALVKFLGKNYAAWHAAISYLQTLPEDQERLSMMAELYSAVDGEDLLIGLWKRRSTSPITLNGLTMLHHGFYERAQDYLVHGMMTAGENGSCNKDAPVWLEKWVECARHLNQWDCLAEIGDIQKNDPILLDAYWRLPDLPKIQTLVAEEQMEDTTKKHIILAYVALMQCTEFTVPEPFKEAEVGISLAIQNWWQLAETSTHSRTCILQDFQRLVEILETKELFGDTKCSLTAEAQTPGTTEVQIMDRVEHVMTKWHERMPRRWDDMAVWNDLLQWRHHVSDALIKMSDSAADSSNTKHMANLATRQKFRIVHKLASVARKQGLYEVSVKFLEKLEQQYQSSILTAEEAYAVLLEQAKAHLGMEGGLVKGLSHLTATDLTPFTDSQKARIFQLEGEYYRQLGDNEKASSAFRSSTKHDMSFSKAWISWGNLCNQAYAESGKKEWLQGAQQSFFKGIETDNQHAHNYLPRLLLFLTFHDRMGTVTQAFHDCWEWIPTSSWIPWIPQLLLSLQRPETGTCAKILGALAHSFPEALFYWFQDYWGQYCSAETAKAKYPPQPSAPSSLSCRVPHAAVRANLSRILDVLKGTRQPLLDELQQFVTWTESILPMDMEDRVYRCFHMLLQNCYKSPFVASEKVPDALRNYILRPETKSLVENAGHAYSYEEDFGIETFPSTMAELIGRVKNWLRILQAKLDNRPPVVNLENHCKKLCYHSFTSIQIPGQYLRHPEEDSVKAKLNRIGAELRVVRRNADVLHRITLIGEDGSHHHFLRQRETSKMHGNERVLHLLRTLNRFLDKHKESRRRHLKFHTPVVIPISHKAGKRILLVEDDPANMLLAEVYEAECAKLGQDPDLPIELTMKCLDTPSRERHDWVLLENYSNIVQNIVKDTLFSEHMSKIHPSPERIWTFKKHFTAQLALSGFITYMLTAKSPPPSGLLFARNTGQIFLTNFHADYGVSGAVECGDPVNFRLTPNLQKFMTPFGMDGPFVSSMCAAAQALVATEQKQQHVRHHLLMFFRDDLISLQHWTPQSSFELQQSASNNAEETMSRIETIAPQTYYKQEWDPQKQATLHHGVMNLLKAATEPENLCKMHATWHPWF